jgi:hypothetical protein
MKAIVVRYGLAIALVGGFPMSILTAEEGVKTLPTLLIKGEVVSLDTNDPSATLLKVKDRYGFETPIFLMPETKISQGDAAVSSSSLSTGTMVEVEYNFDVNTAKRHAVTVKVSTPSATAAAPMQPAPAGTTAPAAAPAAPEAPAAIEAPPAQPALESGTPAEAPASPEQPAPATP